MNHKIVDQQNQKNKTKPYASCTYLSNISVYGKGRVRLRYLLLNKIHEQYK